MKSRCRRFRSTRLSEGAEEALCLLCLLVLAILLVGPLFLGGCTTTLSPGAAALDAQQRAIRDCILSGGHPHAGPNDTIFCQ